MRLAVLALFLAAPLLAVCKEDAGAEFGEHGQFARVVRVTDGDTIVVEVAGVEERVRYILIDAPETNAGPECFGDEASRRNAELVRGKTVELEKDVSERDRFGRLLRYVWLDGELVNERLVRDGFAEAVTFPPDIKYETRMYGAEREAKAAGRGLWRACEGR